MAHNLEIRNGQASFIAKGEKAWHGLGTYVDQAMTAEEVIKGANLDYEVKRTSITASITPSDPETDPEETPILRSPIDGVYANYRTDTNDVLGVVRERYTIVQNREAFGFFDTIIDKDEAVFETAGTLGVGEKIFVTAKLPKDLLVKGEPIEQYLLLMNSHDGSSSVLCGFTNIRVVCQNTLNMAIGMKGENLGNKVSIHHKMGAAERIKEASRIMDIQSKYAAEVTEILNNFANTRLSEPQMKGFITKVLKSEVAPKLDEEGREIYSTRLQNLSDKVYEFAYGHPTQQTDSTLGTLYGAVNAVSGYFTHLKQYSSNEARFKDIQLGNGNMKIMKAMTFAQEGLKTIGTANDIFLLN